MHIELSISQWPACMFPLPSHDKRQELSREKIMSKQFLSIQALTYSCCSDSIECTRIARNSTPAALSSLFAKYGMKRFACNGRFVIMPDPSAADGAQVFDGKIGRLRYFALAVLVATSPLSREVVHLCMDFPTPRHNIANQEDDSWPKRALLVFPILRGHVLTHVVAAMCATCGQERARSEAMGTVQSFMTILVPTMNREVEETTIEDCIHFIQLGFVARVLQALLGVLLKEESSSQQNLTRLEGQILLIANKVLLDGDISTWERGCCLLLRTALSRRLSTSIDLESGNSPSGSLALFSKACQIARDCSMDYICDVGLILQILLPKTIHLFENMDGSQKQSDEELDKLLSVFGIQTLASLIDSSPLVTEVVGHWYEHARSKRVTGSSLAQRLECRRAFPVHDWPHLHNKESFESTIGNVTKNPKHRPLLRGYVLADTHIEENDKCITSLPVSYTDLYATLASMLPDSELTAVCFVCGQVFDAGGKGECTRHASKCGGGCGIFFLLQDCICLAMHKEKAAYITSPYVDSHGETPQYRGRPLNMDESRYEFLHELWSGHMLREHVIAERSRSTRNLLIASNFY